MLDIRIKTKDGKEYRASECDSFMAHWQKFTPSEFLKNYLLRNLPVYCKDDGLEDEQFKVLKDANGKTAWSEGDVKAEIEGLNYEVITIDEQVKDIKKPEPYNPLTGLPLVVTTYIDRLLIKAYYEGYKAGTKQTT